MKPSLVSTVCLATLVLSPVHAQSSTIHLVFAFSCNSSGVCAQGDNPSSLLQSADGNFYGTALFGGMGNHPAGTVFKLTSAGELTTLYTFVADQSGNYPTGAGPTSLVEGNDGFLYGTAQMGGADNAGVVFKLSKSGAIQVLHSFCPTCNDGEGNQPFNLVLGNDGNFYGCTTYSFPGTLFRISPGGSLTSLHTFEINVDGAQCLGMILASDGNLYGNTLGGFSFPTILFRLTPPGELATVHNWRYPQFSASPPTQTSDTRIWGVTTGTVMFGVGLSGANYQQTALPYAFPPNVTFMTQASDGNFWGAFGNAVVNFTPGGKSLQKIPLAGDGSAGPALLLQASNGTLLGITNNGGFTGDPGEIFSVEPTLPAPKAEFLTFSPASGKVGSQVRIYGTHFVGTLAVKFNGTSAKFQVLNTGNIRAIVPAGATTGPISVTNKGGKTLSKTDYTVE